MQFSWIRGAAAALLATAGLASAAGQVVYRITDLGDYPGGADYSQAYAINNAGQVVGESSDGAGLKAFRWSPECGLQPLAAFGQDVETGAYGINKSGFAVGLSQSSTGSNAVRWGSADKPPRSLGSLGAGTFDIAMSINNAGQIVGWSAAPLGLRAFLWTAAEGMKNLGDLPTGNGRSVAYAINEEGIVVGSSDVQSARRMTDHAFLWGAAFGMQDLGTLRGTSADYYSEARDISNSRQVVGISDSPDGGKRAFLWTPAAGMQELGELAGGSGYSVAMAINERSQVVGVSDSSIGLAAFIWTAETGMLNLNDLVDPADPKKATTFLAAANAINDKGQIVGSALIDGVTHAFLLTPFTRR